METKKLFHGDRCPACLDGILECCDMKDEEYLACELCEFTYNRGD